VNNVIKLIESDQDECKTHVEQLQKIIDDNDLTDIVWIGVDKDGHAYYGKLIYNKNRLGIIGALELMKRELMSYFSE